MEPARRFADLVQGPPSQLRLDRACSALAATFTGVDRTDEVIGRLDALADEVRVSSFDGVAAIVGRHLTGNRLDYHDPRNSFLPDVLERGLGLPITLSVAAIEIGRRVGVLIEGVGLPGHFVIGDGTGERFADPFNNSLVHDRASLRAAWPALVGSDGTLEDEFLVGVGTRSILIRMLNNLRATAADRHDLRALQAVATLRATFAELAHEHSEYPRWFRQYN